MRERIEGLGGTMTLESGATGTAVTAKLPLIGKPGAGLVMNSTKPTEE
jgi:signal transduction histidine kinase